MRIVRMNGGLGNQVFQYIFLRYLEEMTGESCIIDDLYFFDNPQHNGYELDRVFSISHPRLSEFFDGNVISEMLALLRPSKEFGQKSEGIIPIFRECGLNVFPIQEGDFYLDAFDYRGPIFSTPANQFYPDILRCTGDLYYYGNWINPYWFESIMSKMIQELVFPPMPDALNQNYMSKIQAQNNSSVAIHIRRGDFVTIGCVLPPQWYQMAIASIKEQIEHPTFYIFSDDIPWVKQHSEDFGILKTEDSIFIENNMDGNNYIDMQLMAACRGMIISNSSFSYLAALLNRRPDKLVCNPTNREIL